MIRRALHAWAGGLPSTFWALWTGTLVNRLGTFIEPFLALYLTTARGLSVPTAGAIVAAAGAGSIVSQPLGGALADRVGRRPTLCGGLLLSAAAILVLAGARALWLLTAAAVLVGVCADLYRPASQATLADVVPVADRRRAAGLLFWAVNLGFSAAAVLGGLLADEHWTALFVLDALTCAAYAVVVWRRVPETRPAAAAHPDAPGWSAVLRDRVAMAFFALTIGIATVYATMFTILPIAMHGHGLSAATYGATVAINGLVIIVLQPLTATRLLALRPATVLAVGALLMAIAMLVIAGAGSAAPFAVAVGVLTLGEICNAQAGGGLVAEIAPAALRGRYAGAYGLCWGVAFTLAPLVGAPLLGHAGDAATPWIAFAALSGACAAGLVLLGPALERRRSRAHAHATA